MYGDGGQSTVDINDLAQNRNILSRLVPLLVLETS